MSIISREVFEQLVTLSGGTIKANCVTDPGCSIIAKTSVDGRAFDLISSLNVEVSKPSYEVLGELNAKITYLSTTDRQDYLKDLVDKSGHLSIFSSFYVTFLIAGISVETALELIAHREARVARLTTSATKAMDHPFYYLDPEFGPYQMTYIKNLPLSNPSLSPEMRNVLHPCTKATALTYTMNLKDFHSTFIGRLPAFGNERGVRQIMSKMCNLLHKDYPLVIKDVATYQGKNNGEKYAI